MSKSNLLLACLAGLVLLTAGVANAAIVQNTFTGATSNDYNDVTNWDLGRLPCNIVGGNQDIGIIGSDKSVTLAADLATTPDPTKTPYELRVGYNGSNGTLTLGGTAYLKVVGNLNVAYTDDLWTSTTGALTINGGTLAGTSAAYFGYYNGLTSGSSADATVTLNGGSLLVGTTMYVGVLGTGSVTLSGGNATVGTIVAGQGYSSSLPGSGTIGVNTGSTLTVSNNVMLGNSSNGTGSMTVDGGTITTGGSLTLANSAGCTGTLTVHSGAVSSNSYLYVGRYGDGVVNQDGGNVSVQKIYVGRYAGATGTYTLSGGSLSVTGGTVTGGSGTGSLNMTGGTLNLNGGTLGSVVAFSAGTLQDVSAITPALTLAGNATLQQNTYDLTVSAAIGGSGAVTKTGAKNVTLNVANSYNGATNINGGQVILGVANALPTATAVTLADASGAALNLNGYAQTVASVSGGGSTGGEVALGTGGTITVNASGTTTFAGAITGSGQVVKAGVGTQILNGANTYTGTNVIQSGTLQVGTAAHSGILNNSTDLQGGQLVFNYAGGSSPVDTVRSNLRTSYVLGGGMGQLTSGPMYTTTGSLLGYGIGYLDDTTAQTVTAKVALYGDSDLTGRVDTDDLFNLLGGLGQTGTWVTGDFDYSGAVDTDDLFTLLANLGNSISGISSGASLHAMGAVPEPSTLVLLAAGFAGLLAYAWRKRK